MTSNKFIAAILGLSMAITGFSAPRARALESDDLAKILFGATALVIIGSAINNDRPKATPAYTSRPSARHDAHYHPKKHKPRGARLPSQCSKRYRTHQGRTVQAYGKHCLERANYRTHRLPQACYIQKRGQRGRISGYKTSCLQRKGYRVSWR